MRIISGSHRGIKLRFNNNLNVRPTTDKAKEALFNILNHRYQLQTKNCLDLFSGTGNISFEFCSRGCQQITCVDNNIKCIRHIKEEALRLKFNVEAIHNDSMEFLSKNSKMFDVIFADPPYSYKLHHDLKDIIFSKKLIKKNGCLIIEHDKQTVFYEENLEIKKYGNVIFSIFTF